jgi:hypothetical protein
MAEYSRFLKKTKSSGELKLQDIVKKVTNTGYVFWDIHDDLGHPYEGTAL